MKENQSRYDSFLYRFFAFYFVVAALPFPLNLLPYVKDFTGWYSTSFDALVAWTGRSVFHIPFPLASTRNGSGDTTYNYVKLFLSVVIASIVAAFSYIKLKEDERRKKLLFYWITIYVQYWFAITMIDYGISKVIKLQFPFPYGTLTETYGDSSPMRLMWNFMGYSTPYNLITGGIEIIAGALLLFRRWSLLGLLLSTGILANVVALNFCYDVPVKLFSVNLLLAVLFLTTPYLKRLADFFLRNKAVPAADDKKEHRTARMKSILTAGKILLTVCVLYSLISHARLRYAATGDGSYARTPLFGIYDVKRFASDNDSVLQGTKAQRWKTVSIVSPRGATVEMEDGSLKKYGFVTDTVNRRIRVQADEGSGKASQFVYIPQGADRLTITGQLGNDSVFILLQKQDLQKYELINRSFHWINEAPYK